MASYQRLAHPTLLLGDGLHLPIKYHSDTATTMQISRGPSAVAISLGALMSLFGLFYGRIQQPKNGCAANDLASPVSVKLIPVPSKAP